jgi:UDP-glucose 4-epimerase
VLNAADNVTNIPIERRLEGRRAGDPAMLGSDHRTILEQLDRRPRHADLDGIVRETLAWERAPAKKGHLKVRSGGAACRTHATRH